MTGETDERKVASELEKGNGASLAELLRDKFQEDRVKSLQKVEQFYKQDLAAHQEVSVDLRFDTSSFWHNEINVTDNKSGTTLYHDRQNLKELTHSETEAVLSPSGGDAQVNKGIYSAPSDRQPIDQSTVASVTKDLEDGDPQSLNLALSDRMQEERVRFLYAVRDKNQDDLLHNRTKYKLDIEVEGFKMHNNELTVSRDSGASAWNWNNPSGLYFEDLDMRTDKRQVSMQTLTGRIAREFR